MLFKTHFLNVALKVFSSFYIHNGEIGTDANVERPLCEGC